MEEHGKSYSGHRRGGPRRRDRAHAPHIVKQQHPGTEFLHEFMRDNLADGDPKPEKRPDRS
jgi:hypothetical protein